MDELIRWAKPVRADTRDSLQVGVHHVAITFDDAFQSVAENAIPELIQRGIPSTIFVPTGNLGQHPEWDIEIDHPDRHEIVMTADQLRDLPSELVSIGSHTVMHPRLTHIEENDARRELSVSRHKLESILGRDIKVLSFPHGAYNEELVDLSRQAGYDRVFTIDPTLAFSNPGEYVTGRVQVNTTDWLLEFRLKAAGAYRWHPFVSALKRKLLGMAAGNRSKGDSLTATYRTRPSPRTVCRAQGNHS
jgi:peptidoglycan/xylan/chitin deacetylase (PgdA/CDA1 family)